MQTSGIYRREQSQVQRGRQKAGGGRLFSAHPQQLWEPVAAGGTWLAFQETQPPREPSTHLGSTQLASVTVEARINKVQTPLLRATQFRGDPCTMCFPRGPLCGCNMWDIQDQRKIEPYKEASEGAEKELNHQGIYLDTVYTSATWMILASQITSAGWGGQAWCPQTLPSQSRLSAPVLLLCPACSQASSAWWSSSPALCPLGN